VHALHSSIIRISAVLKKNIADQTCPTNMITQGVVGEIEEPSIRRKGDVTMSKDILGRCLLRLFFVLFCMAWLPYSVRAETTKGLSFGETLYVPIYSNVYAGPKGVTHQLATMLSIHNIDPKHAITILIADYYDSNGKHIESYIKKPVELKPFAHTFFYLKEYDTRGGPGANFIVKWQSEKKVTQPIVEALIYGARAGLSFTSSGKIISEHTE
jgi:hypothetical protein